MGWSRQEGTGRRLRDPLRFGRDEGGDSQDRLITGAVVKPGCKPGPRFSCSRQTAQELDERTYRQEFLGSFENGGIGRAYYAFGRPQNVRTLRYDPTQPLFWSLDFNMNPSCSRLGLMVKGRVQSIDELILRNCNGRAAR